MAGITLQVAEQKLQLWLAADDAVARNQTFEVEGRKVTRADSLAITANIERWDRWVKKLSRTRPRTSYVLGGGR